MTRLRWFPLMALCCLLWGGPLQAQGSTWEALIKGGEAALERQDFAAAEEQFKAALEAAERFPPNDPRVGKTLNNLAAIYYARGDYRRAEPLLRRAVEAMERALGPNDPDLAQSLKNLAAVYYLQKDYAAAEPLLTRSLAIWEAAVGSDHPYVATLLSNLAGLYQAQGQYSRAEPLLARALGIWETLLGPNHPDVARSRQILRQLQTAIASGGQNLAALEDPSPPEPEPETAVQPESEPKAAGDSKIVFAPQTKHEEEGAATDDTPSPRDSIALYLSSFRTRETAEQHRAKLQSDFPRLLSPKDLAIEEVTMADRGTFYRVVATPFDDPPTARELCRALKRQKRDCRVVRR